ncbi:MAG: formimidoylglutamate deiminase [Armatimonadetes bacterium]|nr:formimidoylglutamate deiminase [Armatimonadota bacterium]
MTTLLPDRVLLDGEWRSGIGVVLEGERIAAVEQISEGTRLPGLALLPGLVNGHSHAFQRALRGRTEHRSPEHPGDDFWSWRELMYSAAESLQPEEIEVVSRMAFLEMVLTGITSVGEFHYLHHPAGGGRYDDPEELARRVAAAADQIGIHMVLLRVAYARGGFQRQAHPRQARFIDDNPDETLAAVERLRKLGMTVGVAPHSVRAVPVEWLRELGGYARAHGLVFHSHVSEQPREIEECLAEHGLRPVQLFEREDLLWDGFTGVHAIHLEESEFAMLGRARATVCSCPTTERNLGDGVVEAGRLLSAGVHISLGTDSQCQIDLLEDARQLEYHLRLQRLERAVLDPLDRNPSALARRLFDCATLSGARSLGLQAGRIAAGLRADLIAINLEDPSIAGAGDPLPAIVFGLERSAVRHVWVGGKQIVHDGRHAETEATIPEFRQVMRRLLSL